jgi:hypothetical protein
MMIFERLPFPFSRAARSGKDWHRVTSGKRAQMQCFWHPQLAECSLDRHRAAAASRAFFCTGGARREAAKGTAIVRLGRCPGARPGREPRVAAVASPVAAGAILLPHGVLL